MVRHSDQGWGSWGGTPRAACRGCGTPGQAGAGGRREAAVQGGMPGEGQLCSSMQEVSCKEVANYGSGRASAQNTLFIGLTGR